MNFSEAAADESALEVLRCIEDKLFETGALVSATGDSESDVSLRFETMFVGGEELPVLVIAVTSAVRGVENRLSCDELRNDVLARYANLLSDLPDDVREVLLDCRGPVVTVNGVRHGGS
ncbi:hypothetical protein [Rhodanobacter soli]|uniref:Uncharacterized protein n=1 Tax=Rhodanobacter soli TaxID=590609 RepID=A0ABV2PYX4_9GAMM